MKKIILLSLILILSFILRFFQLGTNPPSLDWDETSLGYNAYSIATSLRDEHGEFLPLDRFIAFGDYKPPGYIYADVLPVKLFGLSEFSVRFPSFLAGMGIVVMTYLLAGEFFRSRKIALLAAFIIGISPWGIHFSRAAFEANLAAFFNISGLYFFILALKKKPYLLISVIFFGLAFYTFNANRITAPLIFTALTIIYLKNLRQEKIWMIASFILGSLIFLPSVSFLQSPESRLRFQEVSIFNNLELIRVSNKLKSADGNSLFSKIIHNRRVIFASDFLKHYTDNFSLRFLFTNGDVNPRLCLQEMGELYAVELPLLLAGIFFLFKKKEKILLPLIIWMMIAPIPAGTAIETPHALRIISILPTYQIIIATGLYYTVTFLSKFGNRKKDLMLNVICFMFIISIFYYLHNYYAHYPGDWSGEWQYGYKETVNYVLANEYKYDHIFVTNALGRPYIYFAFYKPSSREEFRNNAAVTRDAFGFYDVKQLGKIKFEWDNIAQFPGKQLLVTTDKNLSPGFRLIKVVKNLGGNNVFYISENV